MDKTQIIEALADANISVAFARKLVEGYLSPSFGALSRAEVDHLFFEALVSASCINPKAQTYEIARDLRITPTKARNLLFQWQLRSLSDENLIRKDLVLALQMARFSDDGGKVSFGIESPLLREELKSRLKKLGIFADASFASEIVKLSIDHFVEFIDELANDDAKEAIEQNLILDEQIEDRSFRATALRLLKGIARKAAGTAGEEVAGLFGDAVGGLLDGGVDVVRSAFNKTEDAA